MVVRKVVFLFDVDNTLLDNDHVTEDLSKFLEKEVGQERKERYWTISKNYELNSVMPTTSGHCSVTGSRIQAILMY